VITSEKIIIFSVRDFKQFLEHKQLFSFRSEEILHDPTLAVSKPMAEENNTEEPSDAEQPAKKQPYFGSERHKADLEKKKQAKT
jgi:hypothetical protein